MPRGGIGNRPWWSSDQPRSWRGIVAALRGTGPAAHDRAGSPAGRRRDSTPRPGDGRREPTLGRASDPWRIVEARVCGLRADGLSADAPPADAALAELAHLPPESPRLDHRGRLLHDADAHLPHPLRLRRPRSRPAPDPACCRDAASHVRMDPPAAARGLPERHQGALPCTWRITTTFHTAPPRSVPEMPGKTERGLLRVWYRGLVMSAPNPSDHAFSRFCGQWQTFWFRHRELCCVVRAFRAFCLHAEPQTRLYWD